MKTKANKDKNRIYLDHAATTYLDPRVLCAMEPFFERNFGNPSALYEEGRDAKKALDSARAKIAGLINAKSEEIIFTSGGTEGDNLAIFGAARQPGHLMSRLEFRPHAITTKIEHHAVLHAFEQLESEGFKITYLDVDKNGIVNPEDVARSLMPETVLVSVMYANNEIGTIQPISEIAKIIKEFRSKKSEIENLKFEINEKTPLFHTDACQAAGYLDLDVKKLGVDLMTVNGSKIYGPKGAGFLYVKSGVKLQPLFYGGGQESELRPGTENIPGIVGLAEAFEIAQKNRKKESARLAKLRDYMIARILKEIPKSTLNGHKTKRLPNNVNVSVLDIEGEAITLYLDAYGIAASTGSACTARDLEPSHVILALGKSYEHAHGSVRFTLGRKTTKKEIDHVLNILPETARILRKTSPLN